MPGDPEDLVGRVQIKREAERLTGSPAAHVPASTASQRSRLAAQSTQWPAHSSIPLDLHYAPSGASIPAGAGSPGAVSSSPTSSEVVFPAAAGHPGQSPQPTHSTAHFPELYPQKPRPDSIRKPTPTAMFTYSKGPLTVMASPPADIQPRDSTSDKSHGAWTHERFRFSDEDEAIPISPRHTGGTNTTVENRMVS